MAQVGAGQQATGGEPNPVDHTGLCLLSLDGGGVRGLSTLYILKALMTQLNHGRKENGAPPLKPCELFDLIGGTSTGGLIAIMLGRLEMDVDECISAYNRLIKTVFEEKAHKTPFSWLGRVQSRFDSGKLKTAIEEVIKGRGHSLTEQFNDGKPRGCKVFVCTAAKDLYGITRIRSYDLPQKPTVPATICEAALATSAATGFFDPVSIGARHFVDGALGANNPVEEVEGEASDIWCANTGKLKPLVKCFISIGTGNPGKKAIKDNVLKFLTKTLVEITTETEETAKGFLGRWRHHYDHNRYFRLNVEQGLQDVDLAEYKEQGRIETATHLYLDDQQQIFRVRDCVENLKLKQREAETNLASVVKEYNLNCIRNELLNCVSLPYHYIPLPKNKRFVGREGVVETLRELLFTLEGSQTVSLVGLGGIGKTQVALQLAYWTKENKPDHSVFWVSAINNEIFEQAYTEISKKLSVQKNSEEELKESVRRFLESKESGKWLLIVDNADDIKVLHDINQYLPKGDDGLILFTTRSRDVAVAVEGEIVELSEMNAQEAKSLFEKSLARKDLPIDEKAVTELVKELTYLPLAIRQAGAYIKRNQISIAKYLELLQGSEQDFVALMSRKLQDPSRDEESRSAVATTWLVSFNQIQASDAAAADLLTFLSRIEPKAIPESILPPLPSKEAMVNAIGTLDAYAFLVRRGDAPTFDMHSLVHLATRIWVEENTLTAQAEKDATRHFTTVFPSSNYKNREQWRAYLPHALRILQGDKTVDMAERYDLCVKVGLCLKVDGRIKDVVRYFEECYHWRRDHLPQDDPSRLYSQHALAVAYEANGQVKDAVRLLEQVVEIQERTLAEDHPDRLASQHNLAIAYETNGQVKDAVRLLEQVAEIRKRTLAEDHPDQLASQYELAEVYKANGQVKDAVRLLEHVVEIQERIRGEDHPDRLASQHALAVAYRANGQIKDTLRLLEQVFEIEGRTLVEDHPDRLASQHELARTYRANGQVKDAVGLLEQVVEIRERTLAENHPDRLNSQHELAGAYRANGQIKDAVRLLEQVAGIRERTQGEDHPDRLASQHNLAMAYQANGQIKDAVRLLEHVVEIRERTQGEDHPHRLASQHNLATMFWGLGHQEAALQLMQHVVEVRRKVLDEHHPIREESDAWLKYFQDEMSNYE